MVRTIVTITGASGAGKSTLEDSLEKYYGGGRIVSHTSREPRQGETTEDYVFCSRWKLQFWMYANHFCETDYLWVQEAHCNLYAAHVRQFHKAIKQTASVAFGCISPGKHQVVADRFEPEGIVCKAIHLLHPGDQELRRRLEERGEDLVSIDRRISDSRDFESRELKNPNLVLIEPDSRKRVLKKVIDLIPKP